MGVHSYPFPAAVAEPAARTAPVGLVVFHRPARLAPDPRTAANAERLVGAWRRPPRSALQIRGWLVCLSAVARSITTEFPICRFGRICSDLVAFTHVFVASGLIL